MRHSAWSNVATVLVLIVVAVIEAAQQAISQSPDVSSRLPALIANPNWNYVPLILLIVAGVVWLAGYFPVKKTESPKQTAPIPSPALSAQEERNARLITYLLDIAEKDSLNMCPLIHPDWAGVTTDPHLDAPEPYINLKVGFINATVFKITAEQIRGRIRYMRSPLQSAPEITERVKTPHGALGEVVITQWLLPETARQMAQSLPVILQTGQIGLIFTYYDENAERKEISIAFPDEIFRVAAPPTNTNLSLSQSVYISDITVSFVRLLTEGVIDFEILAFNGSGVPISIKRRAEGLLRISWAGAGNQPMQDWLLTLQPQIVETGSLLDHIPHGNEFRIKLAQPVGKTTDLWAAYCNYKDIKVDLKNLLLWTYKDGEDRYADQLGLWDALICCKVKDNSDRVFSARQLLTKLPSTAS